jgi:hypothetical protein
MWLIACHPSDEAALWIARGLARRGLDPVEVVSAESLSYSTAIEHRLGAGAPSVRIEVEGGRTIAGDRVRGMLNRIVHPPLGHLEVSREEEREYAMQEVSALFLSWLTAMPAPVLNRPAPFSLSGPSLDRLQWHLLAAEAGLPVPPLRVPAPENGNGVAGAIPNCNVVVACGALFGALLPGPVGDSCLRLAERSGADILGIEVRREGGGEWRFAGAHPLPDLRIGGEALADHLAAELQARAQR